MFMNSMLLLVILIFPFCISISTISPGQSITDGKSLVSEGKVFELGFFSPGNSSYRYIGIWYVKVSEPTVVWVANRNNPINNSSGALSIDRFGNLVLYGSHSDNQIWSTNVTVNNFTVAQLLDTGNLVLMENGNNRVVWQSFDYPTNTQLPGMKLGIDRKNGLDRFLTSWESHDDPAIGVYSFKLNPSGSPQVILYKGSTTYWRRIILPWTTRSWSIPTESTRKFAFNYSFFSNQDERYSTYTLDDTSIFTRVLVDESGTQQFLIWQDGEGRWKNIYTQPKFECDQYGHCGAYGKCNPRHYNNIFECTCLPGYEPRSQRNWSMRDASGGCLRKKQVSMCGKGEGFVKLGPLKLPDSSNAVWVDIGTSTSAKCEQACLNNCSCTAFAFFDIPSEGSGCLAWYGKLIDIQENIEDGHELHIRVDAIELDGNVKKSKSIFRKNGKLAIPIVSGALTLFLVVLFVYLHLMKKRKMKGIGGRTWRKQFDITGSSSCSKDQGLNELEGSKRNPDFPIFSLGTLVSATKNFSEDNKLGQGGFGSVYKGQLSSGLEIAVKRLCKSSGQGINEFKTEVMLIAKLQHRNLVKLLGCCIEDEEKMLVYEYMPNKSLDSFIFDQTKKSILDWRKRFEIIIGTARGILYLHQDSRLRIIHRDLKASNILLDAEMNPRISDFGMARIFRGDQIQDRTHRVVGTYGYMSPEYAVFGKFSIKSDVFSFGVILLEIITGKKSIGPYQGGPSLNLIENVWDLWREDKATEIVDSSLKDSYMLEVMRCIQIGLLCLQEDATDRPTMPAVVVMLTSETDLPYPKQPAFIFRRNDNDSDALKAVGGCLSTNYASISAIEGR